METCHANHFWQVQEWQTHSSYSLGKHGLSHHARKGDQPDLLYDPEDKPEDLHSCVLAIIAFAKPRIVHARSKAV